ncbi:MAG: hypothetical protein JJ975_08365 [Bacteroidia bacterium]|nr:hypothetical protein [Bacteroidia bacterium]
MNAQLDFCKRCTNKKFGSTGIVCGLTGQKPNFVATCPDFEPDTKVVKRENARKTWNSGSTGVTAGVAVVVLVIVIRVILIIIRMAN